MKKLFENVSGNQFKLITESITEIIQGSELVREGLKKIFANGSKEISYQHLAGVGMGYIKDITIARKCALQESQDLAPSYGYIPNDSEQKFVKEDGTTSYGESKPRPPKADISQKSTEEPEENREANIANEIISITKSNKWGKYPDLQKVTDLAQELLELHQSKPPYSGTPHLTGGHGGF